MHQSSWSTARLELRSATLDMIFAERDDRVLLGTLLEAIVPADWPPPFNDAETLAYSIRMFQEHPDWLGWMYWYFILLDDGAGQRTLIGNGGFKGKPDADGTVELGYAILPNHRRRGYATEAVSGLVAYAFSHADVRRVTAETLPDLVSSIGVLEKNHFHFTGPGSELGAIRYERVR